MAYGGMASLNHTTNGFQSKKIMERLMIDCDSRLPDDQLWYWELHHCSAIGWNEVSRSSRYHQGLQEVTLHFDIWNTKLSVHFAECSDLWFHCLTEHCTLTKRHQKRKGEYDKYRLQNSECWANSCSSQCISGQKPTMISARNNRRCMSRARCWWCTWVHDKHAGTDDWAVRTSKINN